MDTKYLKIKELRTMSEDCIWHMLQSFPSSTNSLFTWKTWNEYKDLVSSLRVGSFLCPCYARILHYFLTFFGSCCKYLGS